MRFIFFPVYFNVLDESDMIDLNKYGPGRERDSVYRVFGILTQYMGFRPWHLIFSHILASGSRIRPLSTMIKVCFVGYCVGYLWWPCV